MKHLLESIMGLKVPTLNRVPLRLALGPLSFIPIQTQGEIGSDLNLCLLPYPSISPSRYYGLNVLYNHRDYDGGLVNCE